MFPFTDANFLLRSAQTHLAFSQSTAMSFNSFSLTASPVTLFNTSNAGMTTPSQSPYTTREFTTTSPHLETFKTPSQFKMYNPPTGTPLSSHNRGSKRRKENEPLGDRLPSLNHHAEPPSKKRKTTRDKLDAIFLALHRERLSFGEFIYLASRHKDKNN